MKEAALWKSLRRARFREEVTKMQIGKSMLPSEYAPNNTQTRAKLKKSSFWPSWVEWKIIDSRADDHFLAVLLVRLQSSRMPSSKAYTSGDLAGEGPTRKA